MRSNGEKFLPRTFNDFCFGNIFKQEHIADDFFIILLHNDWGNNAAEEFLAKDNFLNFTDYSPLQTPFRFHLNIKMPPKKLGYLVNGDFIAVIQSKKFHHRLVPKKHAMPYIGDDESK